MPDTLNIAIIVGVSLLIRELFAYIVGVIQRKGKTSDLDVGKEAIIVGLASKAETNAAAIIVLNASVLASALREIDAAKTLAAVQAESAKMIAIEHDKALRLQSSLDVVTAQLKEQLTQQTRIIQQNDLLLNPSNPEIAHAIHAQNTKLDNAASTPAA